MGEPSRVCLAQLLRRTMRDFLHYWLIAVPKLTKAQAFALFYRLVRYVAGSKENPHRGSSYDEFRAADEEELPTVPDRLSCAECRENGENIIHFEFETLVDERPNKWFWHILEHDGTSKFKWPVGFKSRPAAKAFVDKLLDNAKKEVEEDNVV
jgi:hypothetical protein